MTPSDLAHILTTANPATANAIRVLMAERVKAAPVPAQRSPLELRFIELWKANGGPELVEEYTFYPSRKFRADFAHLPSRTLIEVEGGLHKQGRHQRFDGYCKDCEKYLLASLAGWTVLRLTTKQINSEWIGKIIARCESVPGRKTA